jgi:hypothetical protein
MCVPQAARLLHVCAPLLISPASLRRPSGTAGGCCQCRAQPLQRTCRQAERWQQQQTKRSAAVAAVARRRAPQFAAARAAYSATHRSEQWRLWTAASGHPRWPGRGPVRALGQQQLAAVSSRGGSSRCLSRRLLLQARVRPSSHKLHTFRAGSGGLTLSWNSTRLARICTSAWALWPGGAVKDAMNAPCMIGGCHSTYCC